MKSLDGPSDYDLGAAVLDAAEAAGVSHVVYSSGPSIVNATKGRIHLEGFESQHPLHILVDACGSHNCKFIVLTYGSQISRRAIWQTCEEIYNIYIGYLRVIHGMFSF